MPTKRLVHMFVLLFAGGLVVLMSAAIYVRLDMALYTPPSNLTPPVSERIDAQDGRIPVFVYGTLQHKPLRLLLYGRWDDQSPATLTGYRREGRTIVPDRFASVAGSVIWVSAEELKTLDRYERLGIEYDRIPVALDNGLRTWAYIRRDDP
jgi:gamma-glutamylcyclotransferase (GGCT)/AIG2-like uncharacterized protein YtfP